MTYTTEHVRPGGLTRRPRILFPGAAAFALIFVVGVAVYQAVANLGSVDPLSILVYGAIMVSPGVVLGWLASPGEAHPWRTTGIWISLLSYLASVAAAMLAVTGDTVWKAGGSTPLALLGADSPVPAGLVGSWAGALWGTGALLSWLAVPLFVLSSLGTLVVYASTKRREPEVGLVADERASKLAGGFELGAAVTALVMSVLGLLLCLGGHSTWSEVRRISVFGGMLWIAVGVVAVGAWLHLRGGGYAQTGRTLLWAGALVLTLLGVFDSFVTTSLSGTTGTYTSGWLSRSMGMGTFLLPAGVLALVLAIGVTPFHLKAYSYTPWHHHRTPTMRPM